MKRINYPARPEKRKTTGSTVLAVAQLALENRLEHLKTVRGIWQKNIDQTDAELAVVEAQLTRLHHPADFQPKYKGPATPIKPLSTETPSGDDLTFKFDY